MARPGVVTSIRRDPILPVGSRFREKPLGGAIKRRTAWITSGFGNLAHIGVHSNSIVNARRALVERVFNVETPSGLAQPPRPDPDTLIGLRQAKHELLKRVSKVAPVTPEQFVERYSGRRKTIYENARQRLSLRGLRRSDAYLSSFVKTEKVRFTAEKPDPAPRLIQPRSPVYNLEVGRHIAHMEKPIYRGLGAMFGHPTVMKGYDATEVARLMREKWEMFQSPVAVGLDASRFDQHVSRLMLHWEHSVYCCLTTPEARAHLRMLLDWQITNRGFIRCPDGTIDYTVEGCRMSGDMNTAMGNCLIMCALVWTFAKEVGVQVQLANNGDDCVIFMEQRDLRVLDQLPEWFTRRGFTMKVERPVKVFEEIEFCQTHPVWNGERWVMCRDPRVCLAKDCVSLLPMHQGSTAKGWFTAVGECGLAMTGGIPILQEFYRSLIFGGEGVRMGTTFQHESGFFRLRGSMQEKYRVPTPEARASLWAAFGITPAAQEAAEEALSLWRPSSVVIPMESSPIIDYHHLRV